MDKEIEMTDDEQSEWIDRSNTPICSYFIPITKCQVVGCNSASEWIDRFDIIGKKDVEVELCRNHHLVFLKPRKEYIAIEVKARNWYD